MKRFNAFLATLIGVLIVLVQPQITIAHDSVEVIRMPLTIAALNEAPDKFSSDSVARGDEKYKQGDYEGAIADYTQAIRLNSNDAAAYFNQGKAHFKLKDYREAVKDFTQVLRIDPNEAEAYFNRGQAHFNLKNYQEAIANYTQAIRFNPDYDNAYLSRGDTHFDLKNYQKAIADYTQAIRLNPNDAKAYLSRGFSHSLSKDYQKAIEDFTQSLRLNPDNAESYYARGLAHSSLREDQKAIGDFTQALRIKPDFAEAKRSLARLKAEQRPLKSENVIKARDFMIQGSEKYKREDYKGAIEDYTQVIRLYPDSAEAYFLRGLSRSLSKDYQKAIEDYTQSLRLNPGNAEAYFRRGLSRSALNDDQGSIEDLTQSIRLDPDNDIAYLSRGLVHFLSKDYQRAIEDYTQAIRLNPDDARTYRNRGDAHARLKDYQGAIKDYTQYLRIKPDDTAAKKTLEQLESKNMLNGYSTIQRFQITLFISILLCLVWIISISLHEFGHAIVAYWGGDTSVKAKGYLTLNPLKYTHPLISIILPAVFFVFGGFPLPGAAVYIKRQRLRNRWWQSAVSAAGPAASFLFTLFLIVLFQLSLAGNAPYWLSAALAFFISLHFLFMLFNLMPFPPLDGYGIIEAWLPKPLQVLFTRFAFVGLTAVVTLSFFPWFSISIIKSAFTLNQLFGVSEAQSLAGFELFNRWYCALPLAAIGVLALMRKPQALWHFLGEMLSIFQKNDLALAVYDEAIKVAPNDAWAWTRRGCLLSLARSPELSSTQRDEAALQAFDRAIQINPDCHSAWERRGWTLYLLQRRDEAIRSFDRAIELEQDDYQAWNGRGEVLKSLRRYEEALASFNKAIELRPDLDWARSQRNLVIGLVPVDSQGTVI